MTQEDLVDWYWQIIRLEHIILIILSDYHSAHTNTAQIMS